MQSYEQLIEGLLKKLLPETQKGNNEIKGTKSRKNQYHFNLKRIFA